MVKCGIDTEQTSNNKQIIKIGGQRTERLRKWQLYKTFKT